MALAWDITDYWMHTPSLDLYWSLPFQLCISLPGGKPLADHVTFTLSRLFSCPLFVSVYSLPSCLLSANHHFSKLQEFSAGILIFFDSRGVIVTQTNIANYYRCSVNSWCYGCLKSFFSLL